MVNHYDLVKQRLAVVAAIIVRFVIPALLCVLLIVAAIADYDRRFPSPPDHFTPGRAIAVIATLSATLLWIGWRFRCFVREQMLPSPVPPAELPNTADSG